MEIIKAATAKALGLKRYFSGKPCKYGHLTQRMVSGHSCCECLRINRPKFGNSYNPSRAKIYNATSDKRSSHYRGSRRADLLERIAGRPKPACCEVCGLARTIIFDHCHASDKFRGWICTHCNIALGMVKDSAQLLRKLAEYLEQK